MPETGERGDEQRLLLQCPPVALRVLQQLVGLRYPDRALAALEPVVEHNARNLATFASAGAVAEEPAFAEAHSIVAVVRCGFDLVAGRIDGPMPCEMAGMSFARIDHRLELGIGEQAQFDQTSGEMWDVARPWKGRVIRLRDLIR